MLRLFKYLTILIAVGLIAFAVVNGINSRIKAAAVVREETVAQAVIPVEVIHAKRGAMKDEIALPGNIQAFSDAPVYARSSGYMKKWYFDIGTHVKAGQLLAEIESPEVDQQLAQARADLGTAQANMKLAELTMNRYQGLLKLDAIARQDVDNAAGAYEADKATVASQQANVKRLEQMVGFERVVAPFDGVITARNTDVGQLVNAGNGGPAQELFHISSSTKLRIFVSVPQTYSNAVIPGVSAEINLSESPGRHYTGKVARNSTMIDPATRTLLTEVDIENASGSLMPGAYAEVHLKLPTATPAFVVPVSALVFRADGLQVAVVRDGNRAELVHITQGRDFGNEVEVTSGISENDLIIVNTPDSLTSGAAIHIESQDGSRPRS
jgi:RND family efflux transporter MFP subunit